jgi:hypothetical protein
MVVAAAVMVTGATGCTDSRISAPIYEIRPKTFAVCAYGEWQADGTCSGSIEHCTDNTISSGAFCYQGIGVCFPFECSSGGTFSNGHHLVAHYDTILASGDEDTNPDAYSYAPERINEYGFILKNAYVRLSEFQLNYTHDAHLHYFYITGGLFNRNPWGVSDRGSAGWRGNYSLTIQPYLTSVRAGTDGEQLHWASRIPIASTLKPLLGNTDEVVGGFSQVGRVTGAFIGIHYR